MAITTIMTFKCSDGKEFSDKNQAVKHETDLIYAAEKRYKHYTEVSYSGTKLVRDYPANEHGTWAIYGEDDNPDLGGPHYEPLLEICEGKLNDVVKRAVGLPGFYSWGGGGTIKKVTVSKA
jgi:hypothetical protein